LVTTLPDWADNLPITAKAWTRKRYAKTKTPAPTAFVAPETTVIPTGKFEEHRRSPRPKIHLVMQRPPEL
jgi:hypothetical protein